LIRASEYQIDKDNIIQFDFYTFPVSVNGSIVLGEQTLGRDTYDAFVESIRKAMLSADRQCLISTQRADISSQSSYTDYVYIFTILSGDGSQAETVSYMIRVALHEWGELGKIKPDTEKEKIRRDKIREHAPKFIDGSECIIVDSGCISDIETGKQGDFYYQEAMIEIVSNPNVKVLSLEASQNLLQNKLKGAWNLNLTLDWNN